MTSRRERALGLWCLLAGLAALGVAIAAERFAGVIPCALCRWERWPYRALLVLGLLLLVLPPRAARPLAALAALAAFADIALGVVHLGVEWHLWPSPLPECAAPRLGGDVAALLAALPARPAIPCDAPTYLVPGLPVSMAAMSLLLSLAVFLPLAISLWRPAAGRRKRAEWQR